MRKYLLPLLILLGTVWFLYVQTGDFEFLRLDDHDYTFRCSFVKDGLSLANVGEAFSNPRHAAIWMPITSISYMIDISLFGPGMGPHHLINVALHAFNAILFYFLLLACCLPPNPDAPRKPLSTPTLFLALLCALFWAIHPQRAEAVAWIAGRKELLCGFFTLLGLLAWTKVVETRSSAGALAAAWICCVLACMSKPTALSFPFLALAVAGLRTARRPRLGPYLPLLVCAFVTGLLAIYSQTHPEGRGELALFSASLPWRLLNALVTIGLSLFQAIVPVGLHLDYRAVPGHFPLNGILGLSSFCVALCLVAVCLGRTRAKRLSTLALPLFFLAALTPTLGIFGSFGEQARADRFLYLPMMALSLGLMRMAMRCQGESGTRDACPDHLLSRIRRSSRISEGIGIGLVLIYLCASFPVVAAYQNDYTVFSRTLRFDPDNGRALAHVASEECARFGHIDKGITLYRRSQELRPRDDTAAQLAYALALRGLSSDTAEIRRLCAKFACDHALDRKGMALEALGTTAMRQRKWNEAISCLEDSVRAPLRFYSSEDALLRLGACYCNAKRPKDAIRIFEPLTQSRRTDIAGRARQFLDTVKRAPNSILFF